MHTTAKLVKVVVAVIVVVVLAMLIVFKATQDKTLLPDRVPSSIDENVIITGEDEDKMEVPPNGGGASFNYGKEVVIDLAKGTADLYFENPGKAIYDASIFLVIDEQVILQSELLPPGSLLTSLPLPKEGVPLQKGGYDAEFWVQSYDENGDALSVNFQLQGISVEVK